MQHPAQQIAAIMSRIYRRGLTTTSGGNLSIKTPEGDIWISPGGVDKGSLTPEDICCVHPDGTITGRHKPSVELPFHASVYQKRPDIAAVLHAHPPALVAFSIVRRLPDPNLFPVWDKRLKNLCMADYALPGSQILGDTIAKRFEEGYDCVMLENHGICLGAENLTEAFLLFETLEHTARIQQNALRLGAPAALPHGWQSPTPLALPEMQDYHPSAPEQEQRRTLAAFVRRCYAQGLFTGRGDEFSVRLSENTFLITPENGDAMNISEAEMVYIRENNRQPSKQPARNAALHRRIYAAHPKVQAVTLARPAHIAAFALTGTPFDPRTIPESYLLLRDMVKIPPRMLTENPGEAIALLSPRIPVLLCPNQGILAAGESLLQTFDRLEVAEATAQSLLLSGSLGTVVHIVPKDIADIDQAFSIPPA